MNNKQKKGTEEYIHFTVLNWFVVNRDFGTLNIFRPDFILFLDRLSESEWY